MSERSQQGGRWLTAMRWLAGATIAALSLIFIHRALRFFSLDPAALGKYFPFAWVIMGHVAGGAAALLLGPLQRSRALRRRYRRAHRVMGRVYIASVIVGAICAVILASTTALEFGWAYAISLHMLAGVWGVSALLAWRTAIQRRFDQHEAWADRSYIATVAFVAQSMSLEIPAIAGLGSFAEVAGTIIWLSWSAPMFAYECLRSRGRARVQSSVS